MNGGFLHRTVGWGGQSKSKGFKAPSQKNGIFFFLREFDLIVKVDLIVMASLPQPVLVDQ